MILLRSLFVIFLFGSCISALHISWKGDYEKALHLAKQSKKDLMVFVREKDSKDSQLMLEKTLLNQSYIKEINKNFVSVIVTYGAKNDYPIELFYTLEFPAIFFVSSKDEMFLIEPIFGYVDAEIFKEKIKPLQSK